MCWRPQDAGDARVMGYLPRKAAGQVWNLVKGEKYVAVDEAAELEYSSGLLTWKEMEGSMAWEHPVNM